jgi:hypothetical protein
LVATNKPNGEDLIDLLVETLHHQPERLINNETMHRLYRIIHKATGALGGENFETPNFESARDLSRYK